MIVNNEMPAVLECGAEDCSYNREKKCHARAVTIGDMSHPGCDTFLPAPRHTRETRRMAGVGACKVTGCKHNDDFECVADSIKVGHAGNAITCMTYSHR